MGREVVLETCEHQVQLRLRWGPSMYQDRRQRIKLKEVTPYTKVYMVKGTKGQGQRLQLA